MNQDVIKRMNTTFLTKELEVMTNCQIQTNCTWYAKTNNILLKLLINYNHMTKRLIEKSPNLTIWNLVEGRHLFLMAE